jgi:hypothetical protein
MSKRERDRKRKREREREREGNRGNTGILGALFLLPL